MEDTREGYSFRCMRCLKGRIFVPRGELTAWCPHCGQGWRVTWVTPKIAKIRGKILERGENDGEPSNNRPVQ